MNGVTQTQPNSSTVSEWVAWRCYPGPQSYSSKNTFHKDKIRYSLSWEKDRIRYSLSRDCLCAESSPACLSPNAMYEQHTYHNIHIYCLHVFFISSHRGLSHNHKGCTKVRFKNFIRTIHTVIGYTVLNRHTWVIPKFPVTHLNPFLCDYNIGYC